MSKAQVGKDIFDAFLDTSRDEQGNKVKPDFGKILSARPGEIKNYHIKPYDRLDPRKSTFDAKGKTMLITAGATGIGYAISEAFCKAGIARVIIIQRRESVLAEAKKALQASYPEVEIVTYAASATDHARMADIIKSAGRVDVLVPCATAESMGPAASMAIEDVANMFMTNVVAPHNMISSFLALPNEGGARRSVIYVTSASSQMCLPMQSSYGPSKAAANQVMQHFAQENPNTGFYSMHPGAVYTPLVKYHVSEDAMVFEDVQIPGDFAVWLASPEAEFLNGRFVWAEWDVDDLLTLKEKVAKNPNFLTTGLVL